MKFGRKKPAQPPEPEPARCKAITVRTGQCKLPAHKDGLCRVHVAAEARRREAPS